MQFKNVLKLFRTKQWIKNVFVLAPLLYSGAYEDLATLSKSTFCFIVFCLASSSTYILNDYLDRESDRKHPVKKYERPIASGDISEKFALTLLVLTYLATVGLIYIEPTILFPVLSYLVLNIAYCLYLKHQPVLDIFSISFGFVLRVYSGALIIDVKLSHWMFITTISLALFLASIKRKKELDNVGAKARKSLSKYNEEILNKYIDMSAMSTIVFYSMFTLTQKTELIATTPLVLLGVYRYIYTTSIKNIESPTEVLYADHALKIIVILWLFFNIYLVR